MAYDVQRFNELTKQMSAYSHLAERERVARAAARARRRQQLQTLVRQANLRFNFRVTQRPAAADRLRSTQQRTPTTPGGGTTGIRPGSAVRTPGAA